MAQIVLENLRKVYPGAKGQPDKVAVDDVSFSIGDREFVVLVGPSGCGKTTTSAHDRRARRSPAKGGF